MTSKQLGGGEGSPSREEVTGFLNSRSLGASPAGNRRDARSADCWDRGSSPSTTQARA